MEASVDSQEKGHGNTLTGAHAPQSSPLSPPSIPSSLPPSRPGRPKPPPPTVKTSQLPFRPPLPPSTLSLPPVCKSTPPLPSNPPPPSSPSPLVPNTSPPSLPRPLSPVPLSVSPSPTLQTFSLTELPPCLTPLPSTSTQAVSPSCPPPPPVILTPFPTPPLLSFIDQLVESAPVWLTKGLSQEQIACILEKETSGAFLVQSTDDQNMILSVHLPEKQEASPVRHLKVKQHKTFLHLDGSTLVFDDIYKLVSFYCVSRDILAAPLNLPQAITLAKQREELEIISAMGTDFWTSDMNEKTMSQNLDLDQSHNNYIYVNPIALEEKPNKQAKDFADSEPKIETPQSIVFSLLNGETLQKETPEVKGQIKIVPNRESKFKRPPPRPPSLGIGSGMGLLFSSPPLDKSSPSLTSAADRMEEGRVGGEDKEERKSMLTSPPPSRPPVPPQNRAAPPLPPAPLRHNSARNSTDGIEKEQKRMRGTETEGLQKEEKTLLDDNVELLNNKYQEGAKKENVKEKDNEKSVRKDKEGDKHFHPQPIVKRPTRPVPQPRKKLWSSERPVSPNQAPTGSPHQNAGMKGGPPTPAKRPDVSLYSPQGGTVLGTDPDSCSNSSTEEEGEMNQEQDQISNNPSETRGTKGKRTSTTIMLDKARSRLSTVITGLISHDRRLSQRIVELARDPLSYFGNLVKEHRAFTLETMSKHSTSTELLQEMRQMMTQLKSYLLQSTELQAMMEPQHQYSQEKLESIVEASLCKSVLKPLREPIYNSLEKLHTNDGSLKQMAQNQSVVLGSTTTALGVTTAVPEASAMEKISIKLSNLHLEYSPQKKIDLLLKACKIIYDSMSVSCPGRAHGADDFLPVMMYVLARSNLADLMLDVEYMMELMDPALTIGEGSYYLTTTYGALEHIRTFDQQKSAPRELSREIQDSIQRWEKRRTFNQDGYTQNSVQDFLTVCCPEIGSNPKTLGIFPTTTIQQLAEQCGSRFEQDSYMLSIHVDGVLRSLDNTELALTVKNNCQPGAYCFIYHPMDQSNKPSGRTCPSGPPPRPPPQSILQNVRDHREAEPSLISW
ncbi:ras and Rab interactor 3 [Dunckerocampus dactyliophorus]|uniref:ras and Rab interactor 3 n=1 Tax=Dunckerocampus dactyliophorus TaxID=161453 RepID=UPI0024062FE1|nr:ras and Rab interactor 3 [Dunckerocampus dactyliophorus]